MVLRLKFYRLAFRLFIYLLPLPASYAAWSVWLAVSGFLGRPVAYSLHTHPNQIIFGILVWALLSEHYRVANFDELFIERSGARAAATGCVATSFVLLTMLYFSRNDRFPRGLLIFDIFALFILTLLLHAVFRMICKSHGSLSRPSRVLVIGADDFAVRASERLQRISFAPCEIVGFVRLPGQVAGSAEHRVYEIEQLRSLNAAQGIREIVIAVRPAQFSLFPDLMKTVEHLCLPLRAMIDFGEGVVAKEQLFQMGNIQMLDLSRTPAESLDYAVLKRGFDLFFSSVVLLLTAPLFALIAGLIRLSSPGPIFFSQERIGLNGKSFTMHKFRTMKISSQAQSDTQWTTAEDSRRTRIGAFLRKTSLDELPQFINVLVGDMSVVGPRPERPFFVDKFLDQVNRYSYRHSLKVGITGWAQVNGWRGDTSIEKRVEYDLFYLQNWSFGFDLRIIALTLVSGLTNKNAY